MSDSGTMMTCVSAPILRLDDMELVPPVHSEEDSISPAEFPSSDPDRASNSGHERDQEPEPFVVPDELLRQAINEQAAYYFSNEHLLRDAFLLKHVKRNKQGYVSIKLITSFKRFKGITKDYRQVAFALEFSDKLEVNEEKSKVRRLEPLPNYDETSPSRTVVVVNLPAENPSIETVVEMFSDCGEIALVRIIRSGKSVPGDIKKYCGKHPEIGRTTCAVVEFETHDAAVKASAIYSDITDPDLVTVSLLAEKRQNQPKPKARKTKNLKPQHRNSFKDSESDSILSDVSCDIKLTPSLSDTPRSNSQSPNISRNASPSVDRKIPQDKARRRVDKLGEDLESITLSTSPSERDTNWRLGTNRCIDKSKLSPATTPGSSPKVSPRSSPRQKRRSCPPKSSPLAGSDTLSASPRPSPMSSPESSRRVPSPAAGGDASPGGSPWVQRRLRATQESPLIHSPRGSPLIGRRTFAESPGVLRQPRGPDGTRGFSGRRSNPAVTYLPVAVDVGSD